MSQRPQIMPLNPTVEDTLKDVDMVPYYRPESAFNFEGWVEEQTALPSLQPRSPAPGIVAPSTDSNPDEVIGSTSVQFRPPAARNKGKTPASQAVTPAAQASTHMINQLQQLQREKDAAIAELNKLKRQQAHSTGLLHQVAANIQNTANVATNQTQQLAGSVSQQLNQINDALYQGFGRINEDLKRAFLNQNILYETSER